MRGATLLILTSTHLAGAAPRVVADPPAVALGADRFVVLRVTTTGAAPLHAECSAGQLTEERAEGPARVFRWRPPQIHHPSVAVLLFWQPRAEAPDATVLTIPLKGRTTLEMDTEPGASVQVQVEGTLFGPVTADDRGRALLPIHVPPWAREAVVTATAHGRRTTRTVPLNAPAPRAWLAALAPEPVPAEGAWLLVAHGGQLASDGVRVRATGASVRRSAAAPNQIAFRVAPDEGRTDALALEITAPDHEPRHLSAPISNADSVRLGWLWANALGGGFAGGGANAGLAIEVAAAYRLPPPFRSFAAELVVGARRAAFGRDVPDVGRVESRLLAVPVDAAIRYRVLQRGRWAIDLRAGLGIAPFAHTVSGWYEGTFAEAGVGFDGFGAAQARYRMGRWELALEARGAFTTARTRRLVAQPGGFAAMAGAGWALP
jgi:hypothetical protein